MVGWSNIVASKFVQKTENSPYAPTIVLPLIFQDAYAQDWKIERLNRKDPLLKIKLLFKKLHCCVIDADAFRGVP